jgi:hypothetical protein
MTSSLVLPSYGTELTSTVVDGFLPYRDLSVSVVDLEYETWGGVLPLERAVEILPADALASEVVLLRSISKEILEAQSTSLSSLASRLSSRRASDSIVGSLNAVVDQDGNHSVALDGAVALSLDQRKKVLSNARAVELAGRILRAGALRRARGAHFVLPSGSHADQFIRLADTLRGALAVERLVDWIAPLVTKESVVLLDSWTITAIESELRSRFQRGSLRTFTYDQYPDDRQSRRLLDVVASTATSSSRPHVLALLSVVSSGEMLARVRFALDEAVPHIEKRYLSLVKTAPSEVDIEQFVHIPSVSQYRVQAGAACNLCRDGDRRELIEIDRSTYSPKVSGYTQPVMLTAGAATQHRSLWEACSAAAAVTVHRTDPVTQRHLHVYFDVARLLGHATFRRAAIQRIRLTVPHADLILVPKHQATDSLVALAEEALPNARVVSFAKSLDETSEIEQIRAALSGRRAILVLDDVLIQGRTMRRVHRTLQELALALPEDARPHKDYQIFGSVILSRPAYESVQRGIEQSFHQGRPDTFFAVHSIVAPAEPCPWCAEEQLLEQAEEWPAEHENARRVARARLEQLRSSRDSGLAFGLAFCDRDGNLSQRSNERITLHSLFGEELSEVTAYCAVSCTMNQLRDQTNSRGFDRNAAGWCWDVTRIVSAYHDPLLQIAFLRAATNRELVVPSGRGVRKAIDMVLAAAEREHPAQFQSLAVEHAMAVFLSKHSDVRSASILRSVQRSLISANRDIQDFVEAATRLR